MIEIIACSVLVGAFAWGCLSVRNSEKKRWNNGKCPACGCEWELADADSQGDRLYRCENFHYCWISYNVDKFFE